MPVHTPWTIAGFLLLGFVLTGYSLWGFYDGLELAEIGEPATIVERSRFSRRTVSRFQVGGIKYECNGGSYDVGTAVRFDPSRPRRCRSVDDVGGFTLLEGFALSGGAVSVLVALLFLVLARFAGGDTAEELMRG